MTVTHPERPARHETPPSAAVRPAPTRPAAGPPGRDHQRSAAVVGAMLVTGGVVWLAAGTGLLDLGWPSLLAAAVVVIGLAVVALGLAGHGTGPLATVGVLAVLVLAVHTSVPDLVPLSQGVGERLVQPTSTAELDSPYGLGIGSLQLDLRDLPPPSGRTTVAASVGVGELVVWVPRDVAVVVSADVGAGEATLLGDSRSGTTFVHEATSGPESATTLQLDLSVAVGSIEVRR